MDRLWPNPELRLPLSISLSHHSLARWCNHGNDFKSVESNRMESSLGTKASSEAAFNWKWNEFFVNWASIKFELITTSERTNERMSEWGKKKEKEGKKAISSNRCCSRLIAADWILIVFCLLHHLTGVAYQTRNHLSKQTNLSCELAWKKSWKRTDYSIGCHCKQARSHWTHTPNGRRLAAHIESVRAIVLSNTIPSFGWIQTARTTSERWEFN